MTAESGSTAMGANPGHLFIIGGAEDRRGIDEDTALIVGEGGRMEMVGAGAVTDKPQLQQIAVR